MIEIAKISRRTLGFLIGRYTDKIKPIKPLVNEFDDLTCATLAAVFRELGDGNTASYLTEEMICEGIEHEQTYPLAARITYHNSDRGKPGAKWTGCAAHGLDDRTPV